MTVFLVDRANACQNFDNYWSKIQNLMRNCLKNKFFDYWANAGFWFCDMILGFGANSGFWSFDTILGAGLGFCCIILGFGVQGLAFLTRF